VPGEIRQPTADDLEKLEAFPFPASGRVFIRQVSSDRYILDCSDLTLADLQTLEGFFCRMGGRFRAFRFLSKDGRHHFPHCRFDSDSADLRRDSPTEVA
jgi:hypothetical protein